MENISFVCEKLEQLLGIGIICAEEIREEKPGFQEYNPVYCCESLQKLLIAGADGQERPFLYQDKQQVCFACIRAKNRHYLIGPMCTMNLDRMETHQFYRTYGLPEPHERSLRNFTLRRALSVVELLAKQILNLEYEDEELLYVNHIVVEDRADTQKEQVFFEFRGSRLRRYHHTYQEEQKLLEYVRSGQVEEALACTKNMDGNVGMLSKKSLQHWKNVSTVAVTLATRAAIEGGLSPSEAYKLSDFYIQRSDGYTDVAQVVDNRNRAIEEITEQVRRKQEETRGSACVERCKEYIGQHYREKLYLGDLAGMLGISESYLSKRFHKETGIRLQDYIVQVRVEHAANLLMYSDESLARIAEYVNFPSQSYMGKVFRQYKKESPAKFREKNKPAGF